MPDEQDSVYHSLDRDLAEAYANDDFKPNEPDDDNPSRPYADLSDEDATMPSVTPEVRERKFQLPFLPTVIGAGVVLLLVLLMAFGRPDGDGGNSSFKDIDENTDTKFVTVGDDGHTLNVDGASDAEALSDDPSDGIGWIELALIFDWLDMPDAVIGQIENTRALDGMQEASWGDYSATWTYHPDDGLDLVVTDQ